MNMVVNLEGFYIVVTTGCLLYVYVIMKTAFVLGIALVVSSG